MDLKKKTLYIPGFVPGDSEAEVLNNLMTVVLEIQSPREWHILRYCKRARIRKKYIDRLTREAVVVLLLRRIFNADNVSSRELLHKFKRGDLSAECRTQNAERRVQSAERRVQNAER